MNEVPRLRVPDEHVQALHELAELSEDVASRLLGLLTGSPAILSPDELNQRIAQELPELTNRDDLVTGLVAIELLFTSHGWTETEVSRGVAQADELNLDTDARERLAGRLAELLATPSLAIPAKTVGLATAHERVLHTARIVTDLRPVFGSDLEQKPVSSIVTHSLELRYFGANGRLEDFWVAMDDEDLQRLGEVVRRAETKSTTARRFLEDAGVPVAEAFSRSDDG